MRPSIRPRSKKRSRQEREYAKLRKEYLDDHEYCEVCGSFLANQIHHRAGRIGKLLTNTKFFLAVCPTCHKLIEERPQWAKEKGFSISRLAS